jgi:hypothetical protein
MPTNKKRDPNLKDQTSLKLVVNNKLHIDNLLCLLHNHDSEKQLHQENERKKRLNDHPSNSTESSKALDPKTCSKIVAICLKEDDARHNTLARMHRWNIPTQLDLRRLSSNTSVNLDFSAHSLFATGMVDKENPLEPGKFAVIIKKKVINGSLPIDITLC